MLDIAIRWHIRRNADLFIDLFLDDETQLLLYNALKNRIEEK